MRKKIPPLVSRAEIVGMKASRSGDASCYIVGYKIAARLKSQLREFYINCGLTAAQSRKAWNNKYKVDWDNPDILIWQSKR